MKKMLGLLLAFGMVASVAAADRVGPVSQYGQLQAGKNAQNKGRIYGSCNPTSGNEVQVRGMSLYWSSGTDEATNFYDKTAIANMVKDMNIEIIRFPMGISESWDNGNGYSGSPDKQKNMLKTVIAAAVENDIYVIIDWHSHQAEYQTESAKAFFAWAAQTYGNLDNVIFEVFNEPTGQSWSTIKSYAESVVSEIRKYSDNLILVGNPNWDQNPNAAISNEVSGSNIAYTFHYYAMSHSPSNEGANAVAAMNAGLSVFVSEWGTGEADGGGSAGQDENDAWQAWLNKYKLSAANWSASAIGEGTAAFNSSNVNSLSYTTSGDMVKKYLANNPSSYTACKDVPASSASTGESSATVASDGMIDDFADGNTTAERLGEAFWYIYAANGATVDNKQYANEDGDSVWNMLIQSGDDYYASMNGISGVVYGSEDYPGAGIGLDVPAGSLAGCTAITYKYKGSAHKFRVGISTVTPDKGYEHITEIISSSNDWKTATVTASDLTQPTWIPKTEVQTFSWAQAAKIAWVVDEKIPIVGSELDIDDFACVGTLPEIESSASTETSSETVEVSSSSFENPTCEDGETASAGTLTMLCVEGEWTVVAASSSSATPAAGSAMIDDVEDGDGQAFTGGFWFAYTDVNDKGSSIITNSPDDDGGYVVVLPGTNGTENMVGLTGISLVQGSNENEPYVSLGLNITEEDAANDFTSCTEISYDYMGAAHNFKAIMKGDAKGELTGYNRHASTQSSSTTWTTATLSWDDLKQAADWGTTVSLDKSLLTAFHWEVKGDKSGTQPSPNYLYIDNLQCKGMNIVPVTSSSSEEVVESSSSEEITTSECEDGQEIHVGSAALKCVEGKWTDISVGSSSSAGGSSTSEGGSSASTGAPGVIDDMEDGDNQAFSGGYWFVYNDANDKGLSSFGNALDGKDYVVVFDGTNGSDYMVGMKDVSLVQGGNENEPYVAMGVNITDEKKANNLASCTEISYDYIGAAHNFKAIMAGDETGGLTGYNRHSKAVSASTTWTKATIDWSALSQATGWGKTLTLDKTKITAFHWEIKGDKNGTQPSPNYLYVDNFTCTGLDVAALASSSSSSQPTSSSSYNPYTPTSSSSYNPYLPTSSSSYDPWAIGAVQARGGLKVFMSGSTLNVTVERAGLVKVNVFDMMGHAIESHVENLSAGTYGHSLANLSKGAYIVRVQQGSEQKVIRTQVR